MAGGRECVAQSGQQDLSLGCSVDAKRKLFSFPLLLKWEDAGDHLPSLRENLSAEEVNTVGGEVTLRAREPESPAHKI